MLEEKTQNLIFALITGHSIKSKFRSIKRSDIWDCTPMVDFFLSFFDVDLVTSELQRKRGGMRLK
jgi:hypothetical protein